MTVLESFNIQFASGSLQVLTLSPHCKFASALSTSSLPKRLASTTESPQAVALCGFAVLAPDLAPNKPGGVHDVTSSST
jgi:hypothetical protein